MQLEHTDGANAPYKITFEGGEINVLRSVYLEDFNLAARLGNTAASDFDISIMKIDEASNADDTFTRNFIDYGDLADRFEEFSQRTDDMVMEAAHDAAGPAFNNNRAAKRLVMGRWALEMAEKLRKDGAKITRPLPTEAGDIDEEFGNLLSDMDT